jgi:methoxymalonate biosynthesis acyl carrier protein
MSEQIDEAPPLTAESIHQGLVRHLEGRLGQVVDVDQDIFASGLVSSMFAMELVVHLEQTYDIAIAGPDLRLDNFRTIQRMADSVLRLNGKAQQQPEQQP